MSALLVRFLPFTGHHVVKIAEIEREVYPDYGLSYGDLLGQWGKGAKGWVIQIDDRLIAYALVSVTGAEAHLLKLTVVAEYRSKGLGRKLLDRVKGLAREMGATCLKLEVAQSNTSAIRFYEHLGMCQEEVVMDYYPARGGAEPAVRMVWK